MKRASGRHRVKTWQVVVVVAACLLAVVGVVTWLWLQGAFLPSWIAWKREELAADLDGDGDFETLRLANRTVSVYDEGEEHVVSKDGWLVSDALIGDVNEDGASELVLITWKRGSYGTSKPFWVEHDSPDFSEHVFIFQYRAGSLVPVWMSSDIGFEARDAWLDDHDNLHLVDTAGEETTWEWQNFGLTLLGDDSPSMRADEKTATFVAFGDNIAQDGILGEASDAASGSSTESADGSDGYDFTPIYEGIAPLVASADLAAVCQETPLVSDPALVAGYPSFGTPTAMGDALKATGFDIVLQATNHAYDKGAAGVDQTVTYWDAQADVTMLGIQNASEEPCSPRYLEKNGIRLALFDATYGLNGAEQQADETNRINLIGDGSGLAAALAEAEGSADASVCFLHIGEEYSTGPSDEVTSMVESLIDAGADVVICSHPHVVQRAERITTASGASGVAYYSLGNLASNQPYPSTVLGGAARLTFKKVTSAETGTTTTVVDCQMIPTVCHCESGKTRVYLLKDYTDELAEKHWVNTFESGSITLDSLERQWDETFSH